MKMLKLNAWVFILALLSSSALPALAESGGLGAAVICSYTHDLLGNELPMDQPRIEAIPHDLWDGLQMGLTYENFWSLNSLADSARDLATQITFSKTDLAYGSNSTQLYADNLLFFQNTNALAEMQEDLGNELVRKEIQLPNDESHSCVIRNAFRLSSDQKVELNSEVSEATTHAQSDRSVYDAHAALFRLFRQWEPARAAHDHRSQIQNSKSVRTLIALAVSDQVREASPKFKADVFQKLIRLRRAFWNEK